MLGSDDSFFFVETEQCFELGMSEHILGKNLTILKDLGFISTTRAGLPAKVYYYINFMKIREFMETH
jgi:hypothetical protein